MCRRRATRAIRRAAGGLCLDTLIIGNIIPNVEISAESNNSADMRLAGRLRELRRARSWSLDELSGLSGVSCASLSRIENGEVSPTASVLGRLAGAHRTTISRLLADIEGDAPALVRRDEQSEWVDPATGFRRRSVSPPSLELRLRASLLRIAGRRAHRLSASAASWSRTSSLSHGRRSGARHRGGRPSSARWRLSSLQADGPEQFPGDRTAGSALHSRSAVRQWKRKR